jgi:hypothetical protein
MMDDVLNEEPFKNYFFLIFFKKTCSLTSFLTEFKNNLFIGYNAQANMKSCQINNPLTKIIKFK